MSVKSGLNSQILLAYERSWELYANPMSHCSRKVRLALETVGAEYTYHKIDLIETGRYGNLDPDYLAVNPEGLVPTLVHNGHPVYESDEQLRYIDTHFQDADLLGRKAGLEMDVAYWLEFLELSTSGAALEAEDRLGACIPGLTLPLLAEMIKTVPKREVLRGLRRHRYKDRAFAFLAMRLLGWNRFSGLGPPSAIIENSKVHSARHLAKIDSVLAGQKFIAGDIYTLADISLTCVLWRVREADAWRALVEEPNLKCVEAYAKSAFASAAWMRLVEIR